MTARPKSALLVLVHGSPREDANDPVFGVLRDVAAAAEGTYDVVELGFLECNAPDIPTAIDACVAKGAERIVALPYFLHTGNHVAVDLPALLTEAQLRHPRVEFLLADYLGRSPLIAEVLADRARAAVAADGS